MDRSIQTARLPQQKGHYFLSKWVTLRCVAFGMAAFLGACSSSPISSPISSPAHQQGLDHPITLSEAMVRAFNHRLQSRVALLEQSILQKQWLPAQNLENTESNVTKIWDILDFGLRVDQAQSGADSLLLAQEHRRKAIYSLFQEVRSLFWLVAGRQTLENRLNDFIHETRRALMETQQLHRAESTVSLQTLQYQKEFLLHYRRLQAIRHQLNEAKETLAALLGLPVESDYVLEIPDPPSLTVARIDVSLDQLESWALAYRPEIQQNKGRMPIPLADVRKTVLLLLSDLKSQPAQIEKTPPFSLYSQWQEKLSHLPAFHSIPADEKNSIAIHHRLKVMTILAQVYLSYRQYGEDLRNWRAAKMADAVHGHLLTAGGHYSTQGQKNALDSIRTGVAAVMARLHYYHSCANAQNAVSRILVTLGVDLAPKSGPQNTVSGMEKDPNETAFADPFQTLYEAQTPYPAEIETLVGVIKPAISEAEKKERRGKSLPDYLLEPQFYVAAMAPPTQPIIAIPENETGATINPIAPLPPASPVPEEKPPVVEKTGVVDQNEKNNSKTTQQSALLSPGEKGREYVSAELFAEVETMLHAWASAWSSRNAEAYFSFYDDTQFRPSQRLSPERWRQRSRGVLSALAFLQVDISNLEVVRETENKKLPEFFQVSFRESYRSDRLYTVTQKLMSVAKTEGGWKIFREATSHSMPPGWTVPADFSLSDAQKPPGYAIQVATVQDVATMEQIRDQWLKKGAQPMIVETIDSKNILHYSVRIAYFKRQDRALLYQWSLQLKEGIEGDIVEASDAEMAEITPLDPFSDSPTHEADKPSQNPVSPKEKVDADAPDKKKSDDTSEENPEEDR